MTSTRENESFNDYLRIATQYQGVWFCSVSRKERAGPHSGTD
jgi:hypothetical protein